MNAGAKLLVMLLRHLYRKAIAEEAVTGLTVPRLLTQVHMIQERRIKQRFPNALFPDMPGDLITPIGEPRVSFYQCFMYFLH